MLGAHELSTHFGAEWPEGRTRSRRGLLPPYGAARAAAPSNHCDPAAPASVTPQARDLHRKRGDMTEKPESEWSAEDYFNYAATGEKPTTDQEDDMNDNTSPGDFGGLTVEEFKRHPIRRMLNDVHNGHVPTPTEIKELGLGISASERLKSAIKELRQLRAAGEYGAAHKTFDALAADVISTLPKSQRNPAHWDRPEDIPDDPAALAERIDPHF